MYSKKFNLSAFFCIILYFAPLTSAIPGTGCNGKLSYNYYEMTCPNLQTIVKSGVLSAIKSETRMAASLLRLHFHDCFVNGCDGSVLLDDTSTFKGEKNALPNQFSLRGYEVIDRIKKDVETKCPSTVSCADILALVAKDAVSLVGGLPWAVLLGRRDGLTASKKAVWKQLPSTFESLENIIDKFVAIGLDIKDVVVLSGAHTIGVAQCFIFRMRLYNYKGSGQPDPSLNTKLLKSLQETCPENDQKSAINLTALDRSPNSFDNKYYQNLKNNKGLLISDQALMSNSTTAALVDVYSTNLFRFRKEFAASMVKMGNIGVLTKKEGEIRKNCRIVNA